MMTTATDAEEEDYYTPAMLDKIWHPRWFDVMMTQGQWYSGQGSVGPIAPSFQHYVPYACHSCYRGPLCGHTLFTCTGCRILRYCSQTCQKSDWTAHKHWCRAFRALCQNGFMARAVQYDSLTEWREDCSTLVQGMIQQLGGLEHMPRHSADIQIVLMQPRCRKCFQAGFTMDSRTNGKLQKVTLFPCPRCMGVALCEPCLAQETNDKTGDDNGVDPAIYHRDCGDAQHDCRQHLLSLSCLAMIVEQGSPLGMPSSTDGTHHWRPKDWKEYFATKRHDYHEVPPDLFHMAPVICYLSHAHSAMLTIQHVLGLPLLESSSATTGDAVADEAATTPLTGTPLTITPESDRTHRTKLVIHFCGASAGEELTMPGRYVEMIRLNPHLTELQLHLIGPDLAPAMESQSDHQYQRTIDLETIRPTCNITFQTHVGLYHEWMALNGTLDDPDIVMCCHSGIHDPSYTDMWRPTIDYLVQTNKLFVLTGYTHNEVIKDAQLLKEWGANLLVEPTANPFRSLWPILDPSRETSEFIHSHASFVVAQGRRA